MKKNFTSRKTAFRCTDSTGSVRKRIYIDANGSIDDWNYASGNCFKTELEAARYVTLLICRTSMQRIADEAGGTDWGDDSVKYFVYYDYGDNCFGITALYFSYDPFRVYFPTRESAQKAIRIYGKQLKFAMGIT